MCAVSGVQANGACCYGCRSIVLQAPQLFQCGAPLNRHRFVFVCVRADCLLCCFPGGGGAPGVLGVGEEQLPHGAEQGESSQTYATLHPVMLERGKLLWGLKRLKARGEKTASISGACAEFKEVQCLAMWISIK